MYISKIISGKIITICPSNDGKGGIGIVVNTLSKHYETFNCVATTNNSTLVGKLLQFGLGILQLLYFILVKMIKIAHIHSASYRSFFRKALFINICSFFGIKSILQIHGAEFKVFYEKYNQHRIKNTLEKVDILLVLSRSWQDYFSTIITNKKKIVIMNNIIERSKFKRLYSQNKSIVRFLFLGNIGERKGIFDLLDIIREQKNYLLGNFILNIGGNGEILKLIEYIKEYSLQNLVVFNGWVTGEKKKELLAHSDVYILPSYNEGLPVSILEAMDYGMPVISTNVGGIPEIVSNEKNGLLVTPGDKNKLREAIFYFIDNQQEIENMGIESSRIVVDYYPDIVIPRLESIYRDLLNLKNKNVK
jgi:glycosyltransferase involved in cell wall biosynthesis